MNVNHTKRTFVNQNMFPGPLSNYNKAQQFVSRHRIGLIVIHHFF